MSVGFGSKASGADLCDQRQAARRVRSDKCLFGHVSPSTVQSAARSMVFRQTRRALVRKIKWKQGPFFVRIRPLHTTFASISMYIRPTSRKQRRQLIGSACLFFYGPTDATGSRMLWT